MCRLFLLLNQNNDIKSQIKAKINHSLANASSHIFCTKRQHLYCVWEWCLAIRTRRMCGRWIKWRKKTTTTSETSRQTKGIGNTDDNQLITHVCLQIQLILTTSIYTQYFNAFPFFSLWFCHCFVKISHAVPKKKTVAVALKKQ